ncbi:N-acetylglucosamine kinase [Salipaludibacillus sp. HK11]|uniref:N-acetylglucosamine kinase n=1 Tax=Salipaludibacillus sp. HK11 TaxID=3394320 RepID=UPI0039FCDD9C
MYFIGIDGGGTKTKGVIADESGKILSEATVGSTNPNSVNFGMVRNEINMLLNQLKTKSEIDITKIRIVYAGISGAEHPSTKRELHHVIASLFIEKVEVIINNDAITALYSGTLGKPGIVQIAGTGSITYGMNQDEVIDRVGGWGYLVGERGSGYALGSDALEVAFLAHDGLNGETKLTDLIQNHFKVDTLSDIIPSIYHSGNSKETIAGLAKLVIEAADDGDLEAEKIIYTNATYMGKSISSLINKLFHSQDQKIPVVLTGGLFNRLDLFRETIEKEIDRHNLKVDIIVPSIEPVEGALIAAMLEKQKQRDGSSAS